MKHSILMGFLILVFCGLSSVTHAEASASEQALLSAIQANPKDAKAHFNLGLSYFNEQKYDLAATEFQKCLEVNSDDKNAKELLEGSQGISAYNQKNYSGAVNHLRKALQIRPGDPDYTLIVADSYVHLQDYKNAEDVLKNNSITSPEKKEKASEILSKIYLDQKNYAEAIVELKTIVSVDDKNYEANQNLGFSYFQLKDYKNAAHYWEKATGLQKDAQIYKFLGFSYYNLGDFTNAIASYKKSIELESAKPAADQNTQSLGDTYFNLAVAYNDNALYDEAADAFQNAFRINPKDSNAALGQAQAIEAATNAHMEKAGGYLLNNQYSAAIAEWQVVLKYQPDNKQAQGFVDDAQAKMKAEVDKHYATGKKFAKKGETLSALNEWNLALQMDPDNEQIQKAVKNLKTIKRDRVKALVAEGEERYKSDDLSSAIASYQKAKELDSKSSKIKKRLKQLKAMQSDESDTVYAKAKKAYAQGNLVSALKYFRQAKLIDPADSKLTEVLFKVQKDITVKVKDLDTEAVALIQDGKKQSALEKFQEVLKLKSSDGMANDYVKQLTGQQSQQKVDAEKAKALYYDGVDLYINGKIHDAIEKWQACLEADPGNVNAQKNIDKAKIKLKSIEKLSNS